LAAALIAVSVAGAQITDVNPNASDNSNANASTGGRINAGLARVAGQPNTFYAASEYGGLFRTTDGGANWTHLDGFVPAFGWDVEVSPGNANRVYATSWYDGKVQSRAGIEVSSDAGTTWAKPASTIPPAGFCNDERRGEPSAFGIGIRPDDANHVVIGTNCGVAVSHDAGVNWTFVDPTPTTGADANVWDVVFQSGGTVDICGDDGHFRSTDNGDNWANPAGAIPAGRCSIAASPDESYVLFVVGSDNNVYESDDAGGNWTNLGQQGAQGRIPFVVTNQRANAGMTNRFDVWYSDTQLFTTTCTTPTPAAQGGANRCGNVAGWTNRQTGAHFDAGDLVFDSSATVDACPRIYTTDGGAHTNTAGTGSGAACQVATWNRSNAGLHALWFWNMSGAHRAGAGEDLYFGTQDNGTFATQTADSNPPTWTNPRCCDTFDIVASTDGSRVLATTCCFNSGRFNRLELAGPNYAGAAEINTYPAGNIPGFTWGKRVNAFGTDDIVLITSSGIFTTANIGANPIVWTALPAIPGVAATQPCNIQVSDDGGTVVYLVQTGQCTGRGSDQLWLYDGTTWARLDDNDGLTGGIGVFGVDPNNSDRIYASNLQTGNPRMVFTTDGGTNWDNDPELDSRLTGNGAFEFVNERGPSTNRNSAGALFQGYPQPVMVEYSRVDGDVLVVGGQDSGIFVSLDGGGSWGLVTDPFTPGTSGRPHISRPRYSYFDDESAAGTITFYVGTQGRGVWRFALAVPIADAGGPYNTQEGTDVQLDGSGSTGAGLQYAWDLDDDGEFDDSSAAMPTFDRVGQDGIFIVRLRVTNSDGLVAEDSATVTVGNVAPTVENLASNGPKPENSPITVTGIVRDPGWLEMLTGTIDWGDGTPVESLAGVLENGRPDATLTFSAMHFYGDNGTFTATVCGFDDDTSTCSDIAIQVNNVDPTAEIDETGAVLINGVPSILAHAGEPVNFKGRSTDPGSDDLFLSWDWGDGPPAPDVTTTYLVNPPNPDPFPSPSVQPRDVTDIQTHAFGQACLYVISFSALDDDGGTGLDTANVIIAGNIDRLRSQGYWQHQYGRNGKTDFTNDELECLLAIVGYASTVFNEERDASTIAKAHDVLFLKQNQGNEAEKFDRQLLATLLNFANGSLEWADIDDVIATAEAVRLDPTSTAAELRAQRRILAHLD
jgi:photosystem II stability/assembly factor-like uncharacterized protein